MRTASVLTMVLGWAAALQGAAAQPYSWARDLSFFNPGALQAPPSRLAGAAGDWNGDGSGDFGVSFGPGGAGPSPGRMRIYSGFDFGVVGEWIGASLPSPSGGAEWTGRGCGFADVDGDAARDMLVGTAEAFFGATGFVGRVDVMLSGTTLPLYSVWGTGAGDLFGQRVPLGTKPGQR